MEIQQFWIMKKEEKKNKSIASIAEELLIKHPDYKAEGMSDYQNGRFNGIYEGIEWYRDKVIKLIEDNYIETSTHISAHLILRDIKEILNE